jgi:hypothetical protein
MQLHDGEGRRRYLTEDERRAFIATAAKAPTRHLLRILKTRGRRAVVLRVARFCSSDQRRRRSGPVITSTRAIAPSLALVQSLSFAPMPSDGPNHPLNARRPSPDGYAAGECRLKDFSAQC